LIARGNYLFHEDNDVVTRSYLNFQDYWGKFSIKYSQ
jgi:hypothetical protein